MSVVLVTGSSTGIGLATALHFGRLGGGVYAGVRNIATASELTQAIAAEKLPIHPITLDVDDQASVSRAVGEILSREGRIDVLVNNAGIGGGGPVEDVPIDWVKSLFETNYLGAIRMIQAVLPGMRERRSGAIVNVSSIAGRLAIAGHGHYSAVKHALEAISEALAQEVVEFGIRVAIVEPGVVVTPIFTKAKRFADPKSRTRRTCTGCCSSIRCRCRCRASRPTLPASSTKRSPRRRRSSGISWARMRRCWSLAVAS
jgi:NAD(P)-dependent dehydrogenase (short-subunit alcohol dehydrogenase family)